MTAGGGVGSWALAVLDSFAWNSGTASREDAAEARKAIAELIAAAPSMLALLQEADRLYSTYALTATGGLEVGAWINNVRAAIAAATGDK